MRLLHLHRPHLPLELARARAFEPFPPGPLILGGRPWDPGQVVDANKEARALGVRRGMPLGSAHRLVPEATFIDPDPDAEANRRYIFSQVLPRLNLNGATTKNSREVTFGNGNDTTTVLPGTDWNYRFVLSQPVYAGNRDRRAYEQAKISIRNAREGVRGTEDAVLLRVASNYLAIVDADRSIDVEKHNIALAEKRKQQASAFYEAGESTRVDVLRAETAIKAAQRALAVARQARANAEGLLRADLNLDGPIDVTDPGHVLPPLPEESSLVARAEASRPVVEIEQAGLVGDFRARLGRH